MSDWYDRDGNPIGLDQLDSIEKRVAETMLDSCWVSTVWLGLDHAFMGGPPLIFETMVFPAKDGEVTDYCELNAKRYSTEAQAREGHDRMVEWARAHVVNGAVIGDDDEAAS